MRAERLLLCAQRIRRSSKFARKGTPAGCQACRAAAPGAAPARLPRLPPPPPRQARPQSARAPPRSRTQTGCPGALPGTRPMRPPLAAAGTHCLSPLHRLNRYGEPRCPNSDRAPTCLDRQPHYCSLNRHQPPCCPGPALCQGWQELERRRHQRARLGRSRPAPGWVGGCRWRRAAAAGSRVGTCASAACAAASLPARECRQLKAVQASDDKSDLRSSAVRIGAGTTSAISRSCGSVAETWDCQPRSVLGPEGPGRKALGLPSQGPGTEACRPWALGRQASGLSWERKQVTLRCQYMCHAARLKPWADMSLRLPSASSSDAA